MSFIGNILRFFMERGAKGKNYADLIQNLESSAAATEARFRQAADTPANRGQAAHVIGIEKWGQHRLRVALGEPFVPDEYDGYAPSTSLSMAELGQLFAETRTETLDLARRLQSQGVQLDHKVKHNDMGEITLGAWFGYIAGHGGMEAKRLKSA
jgi:hypothetical protein